MEKLNKSAVGSLKISKEVIATIASVSALEVEGVDSLVPRSGNVGWIFPRGMGRKVFVTVSDDFAEIDIALNLKAGAKIKEVCPAVQSGVKDSVQTMTGMAVSKVNITVEGIVFPD